MPTRILRPRISLKWWGFFALALLFLTPLTSARPVTAQTDQRPYLQAFDLITETEGWILINGYLFWSNNGGQGWIDITPSNLAPFSIVNAHFLNISTGWLILNRLDENGIPRYGLARTQNGGQSWRIEEISLFERGEVTAQAEAIYLHFHNANIGWLVVKQATSPNFSVGTLFKTEDGGQSWTRLTIPIGEPVYFVTAQHGWTAGGVTGAELYHTTDGGQSWRAQKIVDFPQVDQSYIYLPKFDDSQRGVLPILQADAQTAILEFYSTQDGGESWRLVGEVDLGQQAGSHIPLVGISSQFWLAAGSKHLLTITLDNNSIAIIDSHNPIPNLSALDLATEQAGWAMQITYNCQLTTQDIPQACQLITTLLGTNNGGQSWLPIPLPQVEATPPPPSSGGDTSEPQPLSPDDALGPTVVGSKTSTFYGQGFDKCEIATREQLQDWIAASPYRVVNLYIGGSSRGCPNSALTATYVTQLDQLGWRFIPTWVGPQAYCIALERVTKMSDNPSIAYNEGIAEANLAVAAAKDLGLTEPDGSGTVIYYDLESYTDDADGNCSAVAAKFIEGWTMQLQATGNTAGVYGSGCSSHMSDFANLTAIPDVVWLAYWLHPFKYRADATVWDVLCVDNSLWVNNQRLRQYSGGHNESWGDFTLNIDSNVLEGIVADLSPTPPTFTYLPIIIK